MHRPHIYVAHIYDVGAIHLPGTQYAQACVMVARTRAERSACWRNCSSDSVVMKTAATADCTSMIVASCMLMPVPASAADETSRARCLVLHVHDRTSRRTKEGVVIGGCEDPVSHHQEQRDENHQ